MTAAIVVIVEPYLAGFVPKRNRVCLREITIALENRRRRAKNAGERIGRNDIKSITRRASLAKPAISM